MPRIQAHIPRRAPDDRMPFSDTASREALMAEWARNIREHSFGENRAYP